MKHVGIFLSSSTHVAPVLQAEAEVLGRSIAEAGYGVVYGGSNEGCMGALASGVLSARGSLVGVVPELDFLSGLVQEGLTEKILVKDLPERKGRMIERSDAFLVYPGGIGTLDEICDALALRQINHHQKPILFYNYLDYWTPFLECLESFYQQRTITIPLERLFVVLDKPSTVINYLNTCLPK